MYTMSRRGIETYGSLLRVADEDVETVDLSLVERVGVVSVPPLLFRWEGDDALLGLDRVALVLSVRSLVSPSSSNFRVSSPSSSTKLGGDTGIETHLVRQDTLNSLDPDALVLGKDLLDTLRNLPVPRSRLDETNSHLGGLVSGSEEVGTDVRDGARR